ncbi:family 20 glycosylhydrolase [Nonomuraea sp. NBC_01738]|uniref:beta-N-acetylhexosaminidase n=1 Tax=Nonomuraea sp. NBC_01738 TaxID=2976003 RepID=UPI002E0D57A1|nr:family 20 glycosylhydrolase [Nonomuraea sp. NBC_01738]
MNVIPPIQRWEAGRGTCVPAAIRTELVPGLPAEGYRLSVRADGDVLVEATTPTGLLYGTATVNQVLARDGELPVGVATDWPNYEVRGFMLDVGRRFFTPGFIRDLLRRMGELKLNELQLHLNDNGFKKDDGGWDGVQAGFRLASDRFPGLAATDGVYTRADWDSFEDTAAANGVTLIPEIDGPAHSLCFTRYQPELGLNGGDHLDLAKPETTAFMKEVFDEFVPWFRGPAVHFGADEYFEDPALFRDYFNAMAAHVRGHGKQARAWGSFTRMTGDARGYDRDVTINTWANSWYDPIEAIKDGYPFVNTNDELLYIVPKADYYHPDGLDAEYLAAEWQPHVFPDGKSVEPHHPLLRGAMSAVWNDKTEIDYTEEDVARLVRPTFAILAGKMWNGSPSPREGI